VGDPEAARRKWRPFRGLCGACQGRQVVDWSSVANGVPEPMCLPADHEGDHAECSGPSTKSGSASGRSAGCATVRVRARTRLRMILAFSGAVKFAAASTVRDAAMPCETGQTPHMRWVMSGASSGCGSGGSPRSLGREYPRISRRHLPLPVDRVHVTSTFRWPSRRVTGIDRDCARHGFPSSADSSERRIGATDAYGV